MCVVYPYVVWSNRTHIRQAVVKAFLLDLLLESFIVCELK